MILLTGCTPPLPQAFPVSSAASPSAASEATLRRSDRVAAPRAAVAALRDYLRTGRRPHAWWAALEPHLSADARRDYAGTDPATIAAARLTGPATVPPASLPALARVAVPTNTGSYLLLLTPSGQRWVVERIVAPEAVSR